MVVIAMVMWDDGNVMLPHHASPLLSNVMENAGKTFQNVQMNAVLQVLKMGFGNAISMDKRNV